MLFAVHLSDGVVTPPWQAGGWVVAAGLVALSARHVRDDEIPRIGVLTAAFFVASQVHLPLVGVSVHLLLNGLLGVVLGVRAGLAIAVGLFLQAMLFGHGGVYTLGLNVSIYTLPALLAGLAFAPVRRSGVLCRPAVRFVAVTGIAIVWLVTAAVAVQWAWGKVAAGRSPFPADPSLWWAADPAIAAVLLLLAVSAGVAERRLEADPEFPLGLLLGAATAYATVGLNCLVLWAGGVREVHGLAGVVFLAHLPVAAVESVGVGFVVAFLAKAKPERLGGHRPAGSGNTSPNGTSH